MLGMYFFIQTVIIQNSSVSTKNFME